MSNIDLCPTWAWPGPGPGRPGPGRARPGPGPVQNVFIYDFFNFSKTCFLKKRNRRFHENRGEILSRTAAKRRSGDPCRPHSRTISIFLQKNRFSIGPHCGGTAATPRRHRPGKDNSAPEEDLHNKNPSLTLSGEKSSTKAWEPMEHAWHVFGIS